MEASIEKAIDSATLTLKELSAMLPRYVGNEEITRVIQDAIERRLGAS